MQELGSLALAFRDLLPDVVEAETDAPGVDPTEGHRRQVVDVVSLEIKTETNQNKKKKVFVILRGCIFSTLKVQK